MKKKGRKLVWLLLFVTLLVPGYMAFRHYGEGYWYNAHNTLIMKVCNRDHVIHKNEFDRISKVGTPGDVMSVTGSLFLAARLEGKKLHDAKKELAKDVPSLSNEEIAKMMKDGHFIMLVKIDPSNMEHHGVTYYLSQEEYNEFKGRDYKMGDIVTLKSKYLGTFQKESIKDGEMKGYLHVFSEGVKVVSK